MGTIQPSMSDCTNPAGNGNKIPSALVSRSPLAWVTFFGPGAVMASLTIGAGELVFSSRGGAIFGYRLLWFFLLVLTLKWALVFASARHIVLTGAHPFQRWMELPGPRGWFPLVFFLFAVICFPIWVCFHAGTVGTLVSWLADTEQSFNGGAHYLWGIFVLGGVLVLVFTNGYQALERIQLVIVLLMLVCVGASLFLVKPDWLEFLKGFVIPQSFHYPDWLTMETHGDIASRPVWVEITTYVGVIGGSSYDYLAYVSYLRDKHWGRAGMLPATTAELEAMGRDETQINCRWLRAPLVDCTLSFLAVLLFSAVFVACGAVILGAQRKIPGGANLLLLQAEFVTPVYPWLKYIYFVGAFLTIFGTLYGTIEVAPTVLREMALALNPAGARKQAAKLRFWSVLWVGVGGGVVLLGSFLYHRFSGALNPPGLIAILTPANLFTGVLGCGLICLLNPWMDRRFLPRHLRMPWLLTALNILAGIVFLALGIKGYWDHSGWVACFILAGTVMLGWIAAGVLKLSAEQRR